MTRETRHSSAALAIQRVDPVRLRATGRLRAQLTLLIFLAFRMPPIDLTPGPSMLPPTPAITTLSPHRSHQPNPARA